MRHNSYGHEIKMTETIYFVYVLFAGVPMPQKWYGNKVNSANSKPALYAQKHLLTEQEHNLTIKELCQKYPYIEKENQNAS